MGYEMARSLLPVWQASPDALRPVTVHAIKQGLDMPAAELPRLASTSSPA